MKSNEYQEVQSERQEPTFYARIPKMASLDLDPYELALYCNYKQTASEKGACTKSNSTLADETGMSVTKIKMTRKALEEKGFIRIEHRVGEDGIENQTLLITIVDVWTENHRRFSGGDHHTTGGDHHTTGGGSPRDGGEVTTRLQRKTSKEKPVKKNQEEKGILPNGDPPILQSEEGLPDPETPTPPKVLTEKQAARAALNAAVKFVFRVEEMSPVNLANWGNFFTGQVQENGSKGRRMGDWFEHQILPGMTLDEIHAFGMWCGKPPFRKCSELNIEVNQFRADPRHDGMVERARLDREAREDLAARQTAGGDDQPQPAPDADGQYYPDVAARFAEMVQAVGNKFAAGGKKS